MAVGGRGVPFHQSCPTPDHLAGYEDPGVRFFAALLLRFIARPELVTRGLDDATVEPAVHHCDSLFLREPPEQRLLTRSPGFQVLLFGLSTCQSLPDLQVATLQHPELHPEKASNHIAGVQDEAPAIA